MASQIETILHETELIYSVQYIKLHPCEGQALHLVQRIDLYIRMIAKNEMTFFQSVICSHLCPASD